MKEKLLQNNILYSNGKMNSNAVRMVKKNSDLLEELVFKTPFLPQDAEIKERLYCVINDITERKICPVCSTPLKLKTSGPTRYGEFCSIECVHKSNDCVERRKKTMVERYGVEYTAQSKVLTDKMHKTCQERYGVNNPFEMIEKIKDDIRGKFGVDNVMYVPDVKKKHQKSCELQRKNKTKRKKNWSKTWKRNNPKKINEYGRKYKKRYPYKGRALCAKRRAQKMNATPKWVDYGKILEIYKECERINRINDTNEKYVVDHIIPLQGENVSGLHIAENLRIVTNAENSRKNNKFIEELI